MQKFNKARSGVFQGCHSVPLQTEETEPKKQNPSTRERSSTELRFASFPRSIVKDPGRLSRVKMNALRAPLTASQDLTVACANFLLDEANDFIDERNGDISPTTWKLCDHLLRCPLKPISSPAFTMQAGRRWRQRCSISASVLMNVVPSRPVHSPRHAFIPKLSK